jgi:hypothetical protein
MTTVNDIPNGRVWALGNEYVEAAEILFDYNRLQPAVILAALGIAILLKSFLATENRKGQVTTIGGHDLRVIFDNIDERNRLEIEKCFSELDSTTDLRRGLERFDRIFTSARYRYEPTAPLSVGSDVIYFARNLCDSILLLEKRRAA